VIKVERDCGKQCVSRSLANNLQSHHFCGFKPSLHCLLLEDHSPTIDHADSVQSKLWQQSDAEGESLMPSRKLQLTKFPFQRPKTGDALCKECFFKAFEFEIHMTITRFKLFEPGQKIAVAASGGKDSTVLAHVMKLLNERYDYGLHLVLLSIDEGIPGYRDDSLETVKQNRDDYQMDLKVLSYEELYGWTMERIVEKIGRSNNCTFCGVFRRQALDRGAQMLKVDSIVTGHNADDIAETVLMNILRGDTARLSRCTEIVTGGGENMIPRVKPLKYAYEKEIVMYAYHKKLVYFSTECTFAPNA
jgi:cytoplasmic tRNA 2-thiolation protein 1